jgi:hypothetical protein
VYQIHGRQRPTWEKQRKQKKKKEKKKKEATAILERFAVFPSDMMFKTNFKALKKIQNKCLCAHNPA